MQSAYVLSIDDLVITGCSCRWKSGFQGISSMKKKTKVQHSVELPFLLREETGNSAQGLWEAGGWVGGKEEAVFFLNIPWVLFSF